MKIIYLKRRWVIFISGFFIALTFWIINVDREVEQVEILQGESVDVIEQEGDAEIDIEEGSNNILKEDDTESDIIENETEEDVTSADLIPPDEVEEWEMEEDKDFFVAYRLERDRVRSKEIERLNQFIDNPNTSDEAKSEAESELLDLVKIREKELTLENLIRANGFEDAIFFFRNGSANVIVKVENLSETEIRQIAEIVSENAGVSISNVKVIEYN
ncbi:SpoIIIAH-like family protein [Natranaerobius trueperi]|uniref:Stage III sporulation protein AH n=1 Tax=Natranaerobius trueperi TaxID=759412 RepID=A0A226C0A9_9FIRM|nr:SpoIIIAH-like family protein [Natranaerobius trueperi]OWZ84024.1 hypothetical protein CDO51_05555 [Natranaerobius trueperi]